jgi:hypothetical protein
MIREYVEIGSCASIEQLMSMLAEVKRSMPPGAGPEQVQLRGDDNFGRHILVTYMRPERPDELDLLSRAGACAASWGDPQSSVVYLKAQGHN